MEYDFIARYKERLPPPNHAESPDACGRSFDDKIFYYAPFPGLSAAAPFRIQFAGTSVWKKGDYYLRANSSRFIIEYIETGTVLLIQNGRERRIDSGNVFLLHKRAAHVYIAESDVLRKTYVCFEGAMLDQYLAISDLRLYDMLRIPAGSPLPRLMRMAVRRVKNAAGLPADTLYLAAYELILAVAACIGVPHAPAVNAAAAFIRQNLNTGVSVEEIARAAGMSVPYVSRLFLKELRVSPVRYHHQLRMEWARNMVAQSGWSMKQIAQFLGYPDQLYFTKRFKAYTGRSPSAYREESSTGHSARARDRDDWLLPTESRGVSGTRG